MLPNKRDSKPWVPIHLSFLIGHLTFISQFAANNVKKNRLVGCVAFDSSRCRLAGDNQAKKHPIAHRLWPIAIVDIMAPSF